MGWMECYKHQHRIRLLISALAVGECQIIAVACAVVGVLPILTAPSCTSEKWALLLFEHKYFQLIPSHNVDYMILLDFFPVTCFARTTIQ